VRGGRFFVSVGCVILWLWSLILTCAMSRDRPTGTQVFNFSWLVPIVIYLLVLLRYKARQLGGAAWLTQENRSSLYNQSTNVLFLSPLFRLSWLLPPLNAGCFYGFSAGKIINHGGIHNSNPQRSVISSTEDGPWSCVR